MEEVTDTKEGFHHITIDERVCIIKFTCKTLKRQTGEAVSFITCVLYISVLAEFREGNEKSFTPQVISIGPLKDMEEHKLRFLNDSLSRAQVSLDDCVELLTRKEVKLINCYAGPIEFDSDKFVEIILIDAAFIVEVFLRNNNNTSSHKHVQKNHEHDHFFGRPWKLRFIKNDTLLIENQVPFFIIEDLPFP
ncbi:hypothetical protein QN277_026933 [Acacia crassicarpa]|uniref:Uncharacterized protein n=1 Tax=Acacia crassicarpa TaxID=499986 RepID=A0AAE1JCD6_9FABA|nr:hypothetical protein QN277_026933 [Acacia crassicarpa]